MRSSHHLSVFLSNTSPSAVCDQLTSSVTLFANLRKSLKADWSASKRLIYLLIILILRNNYNKSTAPPGTAVSLSVEALDFYHIFTAAVSRRGWNNVRMCAYVCVSERQCAAVGGLTRKQTTEHKPDRCCCITFCLWAAVIAEFWCWQVI